MPAHAHGHRCTARDRRAQTPTHVPTRAHAHVRIRGRVRAPHGHRTAVLCRFAAAQALCGATERLIEQMGRVESTSVRELISYIRFGARPAPHGARHAEIAPRSRRGFIVDRIQITSR
eukprot:6183998-Pleurochrysis_carterae.AAC.12